MSIAILMFTIRRYLYWRTLISISMLILGWALWVGALLSTDLVVTREWARSMLFGPFIPMCVALYVISPQFANTQQRKDGEYLSLIFSRPLPRWSYVLSKWLSGVIFILAIVIIQAVLAFALAGVAGRQPRDVLDCYSVADAILNAISYTALIVLISSLPSPWGYWIFAWIWAACVLITMGVGTMSFITSLSVSELSNSVVTAAQFLFSFFSVGIDSYHVFKSSRLPLIDIVIYVSNVVCYLTLSMFAMNRREFFYAND
ncbi:MAG: hypothetical protein C5B53_08805 [Candidatus Melainabacteria bacterium]|nr:MAG: hypothetical protein C5B53_08805 [Candidatus Melainabacteria bacterium]